MIHISDITELQKIGVEEDYPLNGSYILDNNIDASETSNWNHIEGDLYAGFKGIGSLSNGFSGIFDGNGYTIYNLHIMLDGNLNEKSAGLFSYISGQNCVIKNLNIGDVKVRSIPNIISSGKSYLSFLVGYVSDKVNVQNCKVSGNSSVNSIDNNSLIGSLIGYCGNSVIMEDCSCNANLNNTIENKVVRPDFDLEYSTGGLAAYIANKVDILNCSFTGPINSSLFAGGLIYKTGSGFVKNSEIEGCSVRSDINIGVKSGGLVGDLESCIINRCKYTGNQMVDKDIQTFRKEVGGLFGSIKNCTVVQCFGEGNIGYSKEHKPSINVGGYSCVSSSTIYYQISFKGDINFIV